jgi:hypothetical protein
VPSGSADSAVSADEAGTTAFRGLKFFQPAPLLNFIVREETQTDGTAVAESLLRSGCYMARAGATAILLERETEAAMSSSAITSEVPKDPGEPPPG